MGKLSTVALHSIFYKCQNKNDEAVFDAKAVLNALEEQVPEALREWADKEMGDALTICYMQGSQDQKERMCKSPWIKVSDQPPPKDGSDLFLKRSDPLGRGTFEHHVIYWMDNGYGWSFKGHSEKDLDPNDEWMRPPK